MQSLLNKIYSQQSLRQSRSTVLIRSRMALLQCTKATHEKENITTPIFRNISRKNILHGKGTYLQEYYLRESLKVKNYQYTVNIRRVQKSLLWYLRSVKRSSRKVRVNVVLLSCCIVTDTGTRNARTPKQPKQPEASLKKTNRTNRLLNSNY